MCVLWRCDRKEGGGRYMYLGIEIHTPHHNNLQRSRQHHTIIEQNHHGRGSGRERKKTKRREQGESWREIEQGVSMESRERAGGGQGVGRGWAGGGQGVGKKRDSPQRHTRARVFLESDRRLVIEPDDITSEPGLHRLLPFHGDGRFTIAEPPAPRCLIVRPPGLELRK